MRDPDAAMRDPDNVVDQDNVVDLREAPRRGVGGTGPHDPSSRTFHDVLTRRINRNNVVNRETPQFQDQTLDKPAYSPTT